MIAVDTSALMAVILRESQADECEAALVAEPEVIISAGTFAETLIVAHRRGVGIEMERFIDYLGLEVVTITPAMARRVAAAYSRWGKGVHPARLNLGDCFAYAVAMEYACGLLYIGDDFARTDVKRVI